MLEWMREAFELVTNVQGLISWGGLTLVCVIVFVETGLFVGFFLPGDSLLVTAGIFAAAGFLDITWLLILASICAVVGDQVGYLIGRKAGQALYSRPDSRFFKRKHLERAHAFYEKYGAKTIVIARFVPIVRTFAPAVAGAAEMNYRRFVTYNVVGGISWIFSMSLLGYSLGAAIPNIDRYIHWVIAVVIFLSILPGIVEILRARRSAARSEAVQPAQEDL
ncbi:MAG: VTT domain-containing protein [Acidobacteria bacterium]|nr:VTT domain-containing protein [Acidobacteriota bacterium]